MTSVATRRDRVGLAFIAVSAACFGSLAIFGKLGDRASLPLTELLGLRFGVAAVLLWAVLLIRRQPIWLGRRRALGMTLMGLLYAGQATAYFSSLRTVPAAVTSILLYLYPVLVAVLAWLLLGERMTGSRAQALVLALVGVFLVVDPISAGGDLAASGVAYGLATAFVYAIYIVAGPRLLQGVPALVATAYIATVAGACFLVAAAATRQVHPLSGSNVTLILGIAVVATLVPASLFLAGLSRIGPTRAAIVSTLEPATTVLLAGPILGESLGAVRLLGGGAVVLAAVLIARAGPVAVSEAAARQ